MGRLFFVLSMSETLTIVLLPDPDVLATRSE